MRLAVVGLGAMGAGIAARLLDAGYEVAGWNRTRERAAPLLERGLAWATSPAEAAAGADVTLSMVTDARAVEAVVLGDDGIVQGTGPGRVHVELSTIHPETSRRLAAAIAEAGGTMLDAPVSGSTATLEAGELSLMVGGDREAFARVEPVLRAIGPKVAYLGPSGSGHTMKVAVNLALITQIVNFGEAVAFAERGGIAREAAVDAMLDSVVASPVMRYRAKFLREGGRDEPPLADVDFQQKDMTLALELARGWGIPVPTAAAANELLNAARGLGLRGHDFAVVHEVYRRLGGLT
ncbi:MAG TPA: NAD(P)-dependent oxidoreductase [Gaiellaceae bacterium]|nr:NAD(P)-dependent oxidoreductase [Gaiellaceae bacterium]